MCGIEHISCDLYEMQVNLNSFSVIICILLHVIKFLTDIQRMNSLRYNAQFNNFNHNKTSSCIELCNF